jgi:hypothetical protein
MRQQALTTAALGCILAPCATALAGQPESVCQHPRTDQCRSFRAMNAFIRYAEHRWVVRRAGGGGASCEGEHPRWRCTLSGERPDGTFTSCEVTGTVVEEKLGVYEVRRAKATRSCPVRRS